MRTSKDKIQFVILCVVGIAVLCLSAFGGKAAPLNVPTNPGTTNLVSWWALDETSGMRYDSHGSNSLTDNNTVGYDTGNISNAAYFIKENSEYFSKSDASSLSTGDIDLTIGFMVKFNQVTTGQSIISKRGSSLPDSGEYVVNLDGGYLYFYIYGPTNTKFIYSSSALSANTWYEVKVWHDSSADKLYMQINDGTVVSSTTYTDGIRDTTNPLRIGNTYSSYYLDGYLDEVYLYKRVLTADERTWLYNSGAGRAYCELTSCATPTYTPTPTATNTATITPTHTPTHTPTITPTHTPGPTHTFTPTPTATDTPNYTATFTPTPTATDTPTHTPTSSPTITNTPPPTSTHYPTRTPGNMATAFWDGAITYGDAANVTATSLLCLIALLAFLAYLVITTLQRRKK